MHIVVFLGLVVLFAVLGSLLGQGGTYAGMIVGGLLAIYDQLESIRQLFINQQKQSKKNDL